MNLISIPALQDNYIWLLDDQNGHCVIVDPGEAEPLLEALGKRHLTPTAIMLTHHHHDHVGGVRAIIERFPAVTVYGPEETLSKGAQIILKNGDEVEIGGVNWAIFATPGHTLGHISYYSAPYLFCGDTMFSAGCGRLFEGTAEQMYQSFQRLAELPDETLVCCAHEYTVSNLKFARSILPDDSDISAHEETVLDKRKKGQSSLPTTLGLERKINLFLRCHDVDLQNNLNINESITTDWQVFALLRHLKDSF
ncbi:hydroxyacylglutathione hydrolase [Rouxiella badensis]|uniref:hydroxyacylglutathione hydrolase n=1 Tax=Rouxiella badensis TaxID=1646377 RepID=UPI001787B7F1|nr:hydroxyacylglutathione hydrolase [Rouxiella badensis]MCC3748495.1 hydroxyacylglutathione hydrolase [Rouxiella badensis]QOI56210.1 hydroxyacylglutathione hydrolase [Rouxiella badensis subsp. acadiensis]